MEHNKLLIVKADSGAIESVYLNGAEIFIQHFDIRQNWTMMNSSLSDISIQFQGEVEITSSQEWAKELLESIIEELNS